MQLTAHQPIAIDGGAGADGSARGSAVGSAGVVPGPSNDHGGGGACIDQVVVPTALPRPDARDKCAVHHRVVNERRLLKSPKLSALGVEALYGAREGGASQHHRLRVCGISIYRFVGSILIRSDTTSF